MAELGYGGLTVAEVIVRAKISRRTFYEIFEDREECFLAAFDAALACVAEPVVTAYRGEGAWRERISAALAALLALFDAQPALARLLVVDALAAGPVALERRAAVLDALVRAVGEGRGVGRGRDPGPLAAEGVVGAVVGVLHSRLLDESRRKPLRALVAPLMSTIVLPFLGAAAAARELERPAPRTTANGAGSRRNPRANPLHGLDMRLTYRTLRVLSCHQASCPPPATARSPTALGSPTRGRCPSCSRAWRASGLIENGSRRGPRAAASRASPTSGCSPRAAPRSSRRSASGPPSRGEQGAPPPQSPAHTQESGGIDPAEPTPLASQDTAATSPFATIEEAIEEIREGRMVVVCDDEDRENEGDLVMAAQFVTPEAINFMAKDARGLICLALTPERCEELGLELMTAKNESPCETPFTVTIEAREGVTTGHLRARPRAHDPGRHRSRRTRPARPRAARARLPAEGRAGGVLERTGQTEASVDLARLAGLIPGRGDLRDHERRRHDGACARSRRVLRAPRT